MDDMRMYTSWTESAKGNKKKGSSLGALRLLSTNVYNSSRNDYDRMEEENKKDRAELSANKAHENSLKRQEEYDTKVKAREALLTKAFEKITANIEKAGKKYFMVSPTQEGILDIETASKRFDTMTDTEFNLHIQKHSNNYQESAYFHSLAEKSGKYYDLPTTPEEYFNNLETLKKAFPNHVISHLREDIDDNIEMAQFFNYQDNGKAYGIINQIMEYYDNVPVDIDGEQPIYELTDKEELQSRLLKTRQTLWDNNAKALWEVSVQIDSDIKNNGLNEDNLIRAERMIKVTNELYADE